MLSNNIILLMGIASVGKKTIAEAIVKQNSQFKLATPDPWIEPALKFLYI